MVPSVRIELTTPASSGLRSTTELTRLHLRLKISMRLFWGPHKHEAERSEHGFVGQSEASCDGRSGDEATSTRSSERETSWWAVEELNL